MKRGNTKPAERALGRLGMFLALPAMAPIAALTAGAASMRKAKRPWIRRASNIIPIVLLPLFLIVVIVFIPYYVTLRLLRFFGLVRREIPPTMHVAVEGHHSGSETFWRLDLSVPQRRPELAAEIVTELVRRALAQLGEITVTIRPPEGEVTVDDAGRHIQSWVRALRYGSSTEWWYLIAGGKARFHSVWWVDQGTISAEISVEGDAGQVDAICRDFIDSVEHEHPLVEVHRSH